MTYFPKMTLNAVGTPVRVSRRMGVGFVSTQLSTSMTVMVTYKKVLSPGLLAYTFGKHAAVLATAALIGSIYAFGFLFCLLKKRTVFLESTLH